MNRKNSSQGNTGHADLYLSLRLSGCPFSGSSSGPGSMQFSPWFLVTPTAEGFVVLFALVLLAISIALVAKILHKRHGLVCPSSAVALLGIYFPRQGFAPKC